ncbi:LCP family protein [Companilactobacillus sp.]|jgi:LCP family protein required for cell wall assembly|uniref:LCP family protein n=1 Tax=Companilactobacillus sp. TaxID=2767905 RepID=UPI0025BA8557|nr:LCP family protein [Companilactobacillus sp.]MCH4009819.1 LCP family protein [Companilactobacillus sp.]MCH4052505.1 LCP family protein [Companilactobacillus sp.]MCH4077761.1 LCP family protein [Companilactobacillus sp.]MCH4126337.1 LCP family protein [Companilactobacillus sp.]MCI1312045.1 LCP family protein [Companilactobacillus sp.]
MKILKRVLIVLLVLLVILAGGGFAFYKANTNALKSIHNTQTSVSDRIDNAKPFSILLLGADTGTDGRIDRGNSDTIMVITVNPKTKKALMYSIPRDTLAEMVGKKPKSVEKINAAYAIGSNKMAKASVSALLNVPIHYTVTINMKALEKTVDFVDGVTIKSPMKVSYDGITVPKGTHHLNGKEALTYARMRYGDPRGDYGRQLRQQQVLQAVISKLKQPKYLSKMPKLISTVGPEVITDMTDKQMNSLPFKYYSVGNNFESKQIKEQTAWINGSSYQVASTAELQKASDTLRKSLDLPTSTVNNTETKLNKYNKKFFSDPDDTDYDDRGLDTTYYTNNTY